MKTLPKGITYLEYIKKDDAENAMIYMNGGQLDGLVLKIDYIKFKKNKQEKKKNCSRSRSREYRKKSSRSRSIEHRKKSSRSDRPMRKKSSSLSSSSSSSCSS
jgi:RNA recognition motif-containing protein